MESVSTDIKKIAVITEGISDMLEILRKNNISLEVISPGRLKSYDFNDCDAVAILGGISDEPILFHPKERLIVEKIIKKKKKVFCEYCDSISDIYSFSPESTRYQRLVFCSDDLKIKGIEKGDLLDDQSGMKIKPVPSSCSNGQPILKFVISSSHDRISDTEESTNDYNDRALWFDDQNLLVCSFRLCNFNRARFAPKFKFKSIVKFILEWLTDKEIDVDMLESHYENRKFDSNSSFEVQLKECVKESIGWFHNAKILVDEGRKGAIEGLGTEVYSDGNQRINSIIRSDCVGEISLAFFMDYLLQDDKQCLEISDRLSSICFDAMQSKEPGFFYGMMRWTQQAWGVCYQDDTARVIISQLLKCLYTGKTDYMSECIAALGFLVRTTGTDGTRVSRTDKRILNSEAISKLTKEPGNFPCAHYNAYYTAALLLAYKVTGIEVFKNVGLKCMETIMRAYPDTIREQSQTEECCRLILPLSWLYWITGDKIHKDWLYTVTEDMQKFKHPSGSYLEWDEGYKAAMRNRPGAGESSLLGHNGDKVVDLLYSNNWLPIGFIQAYFVTGDAYFKDLWKQVAKFMIFAQIKSKDAKINGAWARGFDPELGEVFGSPADVGWGPWAIESGWTVGEITSGLIMGLLEDKLLKFYIREKS